MADNLDGRARREGQRTGVDGVSGRDRGVRRRLFARAGRRRTPLWTAAGYGAAWLGTVALLWPGLAPELRFPVAGYSLLLTARVEGARGGPVDRARRGAVPATGFMEGASWGCVRAAG